MFKNKIIRWGLMTGLLWGIGATTVNARLGILADWRDFYALAAPNPNNMGPGYVQSRSGDINCQLCHQSANGDQPWNAYGFAIRFHINNGLDHFEAFEAVELLNSDGGGSNNITEIRNSTQPGWEDGPVNTVYFAGGGSFANQQAPAALNPFPTPLQVVTSPILLKDVATELTSPLAGQASPVAGLADQLFIADQVGLVWRVDLDSGDKEIFLDVQSRLVALGIAGPGSYDERGLLGFAFHPQYAINGLLYLFTSEPTDGVATFTTLAAGENADHQSVITEFSVANVDDSSGPAIISGERELLRVDQPQFNHNGGDLLFDGAGNLLISLGDGGGSDDQGVGHGANGNGRDASNVLGTILRINPLGSPYDIPATNPFIVDPNIPSEIYAYGFRNPWRISLDGDDLYVADVGQHQVEEVSVAVPGGNHGWNYKEGSFFFDPNDSLPGLISAEPFESLPAPPADLVEPLFEYDHGEGISITGGAVYRGSAIPALSGKYIFGDVLRKIMIGDTTTGAISVPDLEVDLFIFGFAVDNQGEMYALGQRTDGGSIGTSGTNGVVVKIEPALSPLENCVPVRKYGSTSRLNWICF